jgi:hypothetical protein
LGIAAGAGAGRPQGACTGGRAETTSLKYSSEYFKKKTLPGGTPLPP